MKLNKTSSVLQSLLKQYKISPDISGGEKCVSFARFIYVFDFLKNSMTIVFMLYDSKQLPIIEKSPDNCNV